METPTLFLWRPALVLGRTTVMVLRTLYDAGLNLQGGAIKGIYAWRCVQSSLP